MKPYYQDEFVTIYHDDCRHVVPFLGHFDALVTDPPYGIGEAAGKNKTRGKTTCFGSKRASPAQAKDYGNLSWDNETPPVWIFGMLLWYAKYKIIFGGNYFNLPPSKCWLVWDKENGTTDFADCELAWTNINKAVRKLTYRWNGMLQEPGRPKEFRQHPTQKPVAVMKWCIGHLPEVPALIVDPFMGSGSTLRAAKDLGIKCVGIEREEQYCEIAARRMSQEVLNFPTQTAEVL